MRHVKDVKLCLKMCLRWVLADESITVVPGCLLKKRTCSLIPPRWLTADPMGPVSPVLENLEFHMFAILKAYQYANHLW